MHLRRAVITRHIHCAFPGCRVPATGCHIHHLVPRARGGPTALGNLVPLCAFHHLTAIHRWGWTLALHADGSTTADQPGPGSHASAITAHLATGPRSKSAHRSGVARPGMRLRWRITARTQPCT